MTLTNAERAKFIEWLRQDAESDRLLLEQMAKLAVPGTQKRTLEMRAKLIVAAILDSIEQQEIR